MAGHNKWSKVKHIKAVVDAKKGKVFTKLIKEITVAAKLGGGSIEGNARLRAAVTAAKAQSMPKDNIERAIKKGTGELEGESFDEITYEGYGPGGVAIMVETTTDNKNRTVSDMRRLFKSNGGSLGESGSVAWMFDQIGQLIFDREKYPEEKVMEVALEAGANDINDDGTTVEVTTASNDVYKVKDAFEKVGMTSNSAGLAYNAKTTLKVEDKDTAEKLLKLLEELEDHDDVQKVHSNFDMDDSLLSEVSSG